jgi:hypothetical protein
MREFETLFYITHKIYPLAQFVREFAYSTVVFQDCCLYLRLQKVKYGDDWR